MIILIKIKKQIKRSLINLKIIKKKYKIDKKVRMMLV